MAWPLNRAAARSSAEIHALLDKAVQQNQLQTILPAAPTDESWHVQVPPVFFALALLFLLGILVYQFRDMIPIWRRSRRPAWDDAKPPADGENPTAEPAVLAAADELAAQGRLAEAMHALLLQSLGDIRERLDEPFADSLTSREILRGTRLSEAGKAALRDIVMRVEETYFGDYPARPPDYEACRRRFADLTQSLRDKAIA